MIFQFKLRRGPAAEWLADNPVLEDGEPGFERDTGKFKIGDGVQAWVDLPYFINADQLVEGVEGDSAYEVAVSNGFVGTEVQWLASLVGPAGADGADGAPGADGADGDTGPQGIQGIPGEDGQDASMADPTWTGTGTFSGRMIVTEDALAISSGTVAVNAALSNRFTLTATENFTLSNPSNGLAGQQITVRIKQDATGSRTITLGSNYRLGVDIDSVVLSTTANATDYLGLMCRDGTIWDVVSFVRGFA